MLEFELSEDGRLLQIRVEDRKFDITLATEFRRQLNDHWVDGIEDVRVDFSKVEFIDSSGVGALVSVHKRLAERGRAVTIVNPCPAVLSVIELLRLHRVFNLIHAG
jgi:anti-sigma B factor antagonist